MRGAARIGLFNSSQYVAGLFKTTYATYFSNNPAAFASMTPTAYGTKRLVMMVQTLVVNG